MTLAVPLTADPRSPVSRPSAETVAQRLALRNISWQLYEQILTAVGGGPYRLTYDRGTLEIEMSSEAHEALKWLAGRFIEAYAEESSIDYKAVGSTTWRQHDVAAASRRRRPGGGRVVLRPELLPRPRAGGRPDRRPAARPSRRDRPEPARS